MTVFRKRMHPQFGDRELDLKTAFDTLPKEFLKFSGTALRSEFWWKSLILALCVVAVGGVLTLITQTQTFNSLPIGFELLIIFGVPLLAGLVAATYTIPLTVRRLKDTGVSGWWYLVVFAVSAVLGWTWILAWLAGLLNIAFFLYCGFAPSNLFGRADARKIQAM